MTTSQNTQEQTVNADTSAAQIATYGARRATDHEIAAAEAWVAHWSADWADDDDADDARQAEYEHALEILVFAAGGRDKPASPPNPKEQPMTTSHDPFDAANRLAPTPNSPDQATRANWIRHYAAFAVAAHVAARTVLKTVLADRESGAGTELGHLIAIGVASTAAAAALTDPGNAPELIYNLTPEAGALNGEWEEWLDDTLAAHGINPADIDPDLDPADFAVDVAAAVDGAGSS